MRHAFDLRLPTAGAYRVLAADVASRFVEISGGTKGDAEQFAADVAAAVDALASMAEAIDLAFSAEDAAVQVVIGAAGESRVVRRQLPAQKD